MNFFWMKLHIQQTLDDVASRFSHIRFRVRDQRAFLEDLHALIADGLTPSVAIDLLDAHHPPSWSRLLIILKSHIAEGGSLADALENWFPLHVVELIRMGEHSGRLAEALHTAKEALLVRESWWSDVWAQLSYPLLALFAALGVLVFVQKALLAQYIAWVPLSQWPEAGKQLWVLANGVMHWGIFVMLVLVFLGMLLKHALANMLWPIRPYLDRLPAFSWYRRMEAVRLWRRLALLLKHGVPIRRALGLLGIYGTPYIRSHVSHMERRLAQGMENPAEVLDTGLWDAYELSRLKAVAKTRGFVDALGRQAESIQLRFEQALRRNLRFFSGILLLSAALLAAWMILGIYSVANAVVVMGV